MRRVAVTGASGLIGTALTAALEKRGDRVVPVGRHPPDGGVAWDLAARRIDVAALEGVDGFWDWQGKMFGEGILEVIARFERDVQAGNVATRKNWRR